MTVPLQDAIAVPDFLPLTIAAIADSTNGHADLHVNREKSINNKEDVQKYM